MNSGYLLLIGIATIVWGIGIKERCQTKEEYMEKIRESHGPDAKPQEWESAYAAHEANVMQAGNLAIVVGVLMALSEFV